ncbi:MAG: sigma-54-dependent Fis family transcriptional regulator [Deltaproteobacteria bacterium]|nr:sigma-54-dependent Fis family transcriptional regulator [Deltaproteobacteria bacterium]
MQSLKGPATILAVDDNQEALFALEQLLSSNGYHVVTASTGDQALEQARVNTPELILLDVQMPGPDGLEVTRRLKADPQLRYSVVVLLTAKDSLEDVVAGLEQGADDYIKKPFKSEELLARVKAALRLKETYRELQSKDLQLRELARNDAKRASFDNIVGASQPMRELYSLIEKVADSDASILISGESGTGKELVATALHYRSSRREMPFVAQNCSAFNENLLESELFGHVRGAFTGAIRDKQGLFEIADKGTFFLDELGEMSPALQVKLLRVLQEGTFIPVGGTKAKQVDVRVVAATNRDLLKMVQEGTFREDLYYRLNVVNLKIPPLRERASDIPLLAEHFLRVQAERKGTRRKRLEPEAIEAIMRYSWPGNIRQLQNEIERLVLMSGADEVIPAALLSTQIQAQGGGVEKNQEDPATLKDAVEQVEREMILKTLKRLNWNKSEAAKELGVSRSSLIAKVQSYGLEPRNGAK